MAPTLENNPRTMIDQLKSRVGLTPAGSSEWHSNNQSSLFEEALNAMSKLHSDWEMLSPFNPRRSPDLKFYNSLINLYNITANARERVENKKSQPRDKRTRELLDNGISYELAIALEMWRSIPSQEKSGVLTSRQPNNTQQMLHDLGITGDQASAAAIQGVGRDMTFTTDHSKKPSQYEKLTTRYMQHALWTTIKIIEKKTDPQDIAHSIGSVVNHVIGFALDKDTPSSVREDMLRFGFNIIEGLLNGQTEKQFDQSSPLLSEQILRGNSLVNILRNKLLKTTSKPDKQLGIVLLEPLAKTIVETLYFETPILNPEWREQVIDFESAWAANLVDNTRLFKQELATTIGHEPTAEQLSDKLNEIKQQRLAETLGIPVKSLLTPKRAGILLQHCVDLVAKSDHAGTLSELIFDFMRQPMAVRAKMMTGSPKDIAKGIADWEKAFPNLLKNQPLQTMLGFLLTKNPVGAKIVFSTLFDKDFYATILDEARSQEHLNNELSPSLFYALTGMLPDATTGWVQDNDPQSPFVEFVNKLRITKDHSQQDKTDKPTVREVYQEYVKHLFGLNPVRLLTLSTGRQFNNNDLINIPLDGVVSNLENPGNREMLRLQHAKVIKRFTQEFAKTEDPGLRSALVLTLTSFLTSANHGISDTKKEGWYQDEAMLKAQADILIPWILDGYAAEQGPNGPFLRSLELTSPYMSIATKNELVTKFVYYAQATNGAVLFDGKLDGLLMALGWHTAKKHPHLYSQDTSDSAFALAIVKPMQELIQGVSSRAGMLNKKALSVIGELDRVSRVLRQENVQATVEIINSTNGNRQTSQADVPFDHAVKLEEYQHNLRAFQGTVIPTIIATMSTLGSGDNGIQSQILAELNTTLTEIVKQELVDNASDLATPIQQKIDDLTKHGEALQKLIASSVHQYEQQFGVDSHERAEEIFQIAGDIADRIAILQTANGKIKRNDLPQPIEELTGLTEKLIKAASQSNQPGALKSGGDTNGFLMTAESLPAGLSQLIQPTMIAEALREQTELNPMAKLSTLIRDVVNGSQKSLPTSADSTQWTLEDTYAVITQVANLPNKAKLIKYHVQLIASRELAQQISAHTNDWVNNYGSIHKEQDHLLQIEAGLYTGQISLRSIAPALQALGLDPSSVRSTTSPKSSAQQPSTVDQAPGQKSNQ